MKYDAHRETATPRAKSTCPTCDGELIAKCGKLVTWHWAHKGSDCDPWASPETEWHLRWKDRLERQGARLEVTIGEHRADAVMPDGSVVELQSSYLPVDKIREREEFYVRHCGDMRWIYRCHWADRLECVGGLDRTMTWGNRWAEIPILSLTFWWKHGSKSMATGHRRDVYWDASFGPYGGEIRRMSVWLEDVEEYSDWGYSSMQRVYARATEARKYAA